MKLGRSILWAVLGSLGLAIAFGLWSAYRGASWGIAAEYELHALTLVTRLVEEYVETNGGEWPRSWGDLTRLPRRTWAMYSWPEDLAKVQRQVAVDFTADADQLAMQPLDRFRAIKPLIGYYDYADRFERLANTLRSYNRQKGQ